VIPAAAMFGLMPRSFKFIFCELDFSRSPLVILVRWPPCFASTPSSRNRCVTSPTVAERPLAVAVGEEQGETVKKGPKPKGDSLSDNESSSQGTCSAYLLRRLSRMDGDWLDRYEAGEFKSVRAAAIAAGIVKVPCVLNRLRVRRHSPRHTPFAPG